MNKEMGQRPFYAEMGRLEPGREGTGVAQRENTPGSHRAAVDWGWEKLAGGCLKTSAHSRAEELRRWAACVHTHAHTHTQSRVFTVLESDSQSWLLISPRGGLGRNDSRTQTSETWTRQTWREARMSALLLPPQLLRGTQG